MPHCYSYAAHTTAKAQYIQIRTHSNQGHAFSYIIVYKVKKSGSLTKT